MNQAISAIVSPAVGVLISPFPIVGLILILLGDKAKSNSVFYMLGWVCGNALVFVIAMLFMGMGARSEGEPGTAAKAVSLVLGALMLLLAVREFLKRPKHGEEPSMPKWFAKLSKISAVGAAGLGVMLSALNPKNALLSLSAGAGVGMLKLQAGDEALSAVIFVLIASSSIVVPVIAFLIVGDRLSKALDSMRGWLVQNNAVIMSVLLLMIGLNILSKAF